MMQRLRYGCCITKKGLLMPAEKRTDPRPGDQYIPETEGMRERFERDLCMRCVHGQRTRYAGTGRPESKHRIGQIGCYLWQLGIIKRQPVAAWFYGTSLEPHCLDWEKLPPYPALFDDDKEENSGTGTGATRTCSEKLAGTD